jgi:chromosome segregation ATPase
MKTEVIEHESLDKELEEIAVKIRSAQADRHRLAAELETAKQDLARYEEQWTEECARAVVEGDSSDSDATTTIESAMAAVGRRIRGLQHLVSRKEAEVQELEQWQGRVSDDLAQFRVAKSWAKELAEVEAMPVSPAAAGIGRQNKLRKLRVRQLEFNSFVSRLRSRQWSSEALGQAALRLADDLGGRWNALMS